MLPGTETAAHLAAALWTAAANVYAAVKGVGRLALIVPPSRLGRWGRLFARSTRRTPSRLVSMPATSAPVWWATFPVSRWCARLASQRSRTTLGALVSTAAIEVYEQRVGALQVTEPSVLGVQVAYAGYFTPMVIETTGVQRIVNTAA